MNRLKYDAEAAEKIDNYSNTMLALNDRPKKLARIGKKLARVQKEEWHRLLQEKGRYSWEALEAERLHLLTREVIIRALIKLIVDDDLKGQLRLSIHDSELEKISERLEEIHTAQEANAL